MNFLEKFLNVLNFNWQIFEISEIWNFLLNRQKTRVETSLQKLFEKPFGKPVSFELENETYYLGSDVANYLRLFRTKLYNHFPKLVTKRTSGSWLIFRFFFNAKIWQKKRTNLTKPKKDNQSKLIAQQTGEPHHQHLANDVIILSYRFVSC